MMQPAVEVTTMWGNTVLDVVRLEQVPPEAADSIDELDRGKTVRLERGRVITQLRYVRPAPLPARRKWSELDYSWVNTLLVAFFVHTLGIAAFISTPERASELAEGIGKIGRLRIAELRLTEAKKTPPPGDTLAKLKEGAPAKLNDSEGQAGSRDSHQRNRRLAVLGQPGNAELAKSALAKLFGRKGNTRASALLGEGGIGGDLRHALGGVFGREIGDARGFGGGGARGDGPGGGGLSAHSFGIGELDTPGRGGGHEDYGTGVVRPLEKTSTTMRITSEPPTIEGSLDKELIRRVIKEHMPQIRHCYEKELIRTPGLFGKVSVEFTIGSSGGVQAVKIAHSTMAGSEVAQCVSAKIRRWQFPKPNGGGVVIVKYPFIFTTSG